MSRRTSTNQDSVSSLNSRNFVRGSSPKVKVKLSNERAKLRRNTYVILPDGRFLSPPVPLEPRRRVIPKAGRQIKPVNRAGNENFTSVKPQNSSASPEPLMRQSIYNVHSSPRHISVGGNMSPRNYQTQRTYDSNPGQAQINRVINNNMTHRKYNFGGSSNSVINYDSRIETERHSDLSKSLSPTNRRRRYSNFSRNSPLQRDNNIYEGENRHIHYTRNREPVDQSNFKAFPRRSKFDSQGRRLSLTYTNSGTFETLSPVIDMEDDDFQRSPSVRNDSKIGISDKLPTIQVSYWDDDRIQDSRTVTKENTMSSSPVAGNNKRVIQNEVDSSLTKDNTKSFVLKRINSPKRPRISESKELPQEEHTLSQSGIHEKSQSPERGKAMKTLSISNIPGNLDSRDKLTERTTQHGLIQKPQQYINYNRKNDRTFQSIDHHVKRYRSVTRPTSESSSYLNNDNFSRSSSIQSNSSISIPDSKLGGRNTYSRESSLNSNISNETAVSSIKDERLQHVNNRVKLLAEIKAVFKQMPPDVTSPLPMSPARTSPMSLERARSVSVDTESIVNEHRDRKLFFNPDILNSDRYTEVNSVDLQNEEHLKRNNSFERNDLADKDIFGRDARYSGILHTDENTANVPAVVKPSEMSKGDSKQAVTTKKYGGPDKASNPTKFTWQQMEELSKNDTNDSLKNTSKQTEDPNITETKDLSNKSPSPLKENIMSDTFDTGTQHKNHFGHKDNNNKHKTKLSAVVKPTIRHKTKEVKVKQQQNKSEIPGIYSDEEEIYPEPRPHTDTYMAPPPFEDKRRYEQSGGNEFVDTRPLMQKSHSKKGKLVTFYRNGDANFKGKSFCINQKNFPTFETLLVFLTEKIPTISGVNYIFSIPDGREIKSVTEFVNGRSYIVSSNKKPQPNLNYGYSKEKYWVNKMPSAGKFRKQEVDLLLQRGGSPANSPMKKPRVITVISNMSRERREKILINPNTPLNFEELLNTIEDVLDMSVVALFTEKPPHDKVESYSQILREYKKHTNFIACGHELPMELDKIPKRQAPSSNSSSDSTGLTSRKKKLLRQNEFDGIEETDASQSPPPPQMVPHDHMTQGIMSTTYTSLKEPIQVEVRGKTKEYHVPAVYGENDVDGYRPDRKLKLDWIYGYKASGTRNNLLVYHTGELLYHVAAVAVLYNKTTNTQRHYLGHTEEISCMSLHPNKRWIATGQISGRTQDDAHIRIWDGKTLSTYNVIGMGFFKVGISSIDFSATPEYRSDIYSKTDRKQAGFYMCVLDSSDKHVLSVWDWQKQEKERLIARTTTSIRSVSCACFYPRDHSILITYGEGHIYFWQLFWNPERESEGRLLRDKESGMFLDETPKMITSIAFADNGDVLTGDSSGSITIWSLDQNYAFKVNHILSTKLKYAHRRPVTALTVLTDGTLLSGGGIEIRAWDSFNGYNVTKDRKIPDFAGDVCAIVPIKPDATDGELYIGTSKSCILEGSLQKQFIFRVHGHSNELWSIEAHPEEMTFFTAAHDQQVIKWKSREHKIAWRVRVESPCSSIAIDGRGKHLAIGTVAGQLILLNAENGMHIITVPVGREQINAIKYSSDESMLALGDHGGCIHIFYVHEDGRLYRKNNAKLRGGGSFVTQLDWSSDNRFIQSCNGDYDLKYWNVEDMQQIKDLEWMKDVDWHTSTCNVGYSVCGAWTNLDPEEHLHVAKRAQYRELLITGDNRGRLRLYKYPCASIKPDFRGTKLYSSDVTAVNFLYDDSVVISSGGTFPVLAQWTVMDRK